MDAKYYMIPNQEMFRSNLLSGEFNLDSATKIQLSLICADKMLFDQFGTSWEIYYHSRIPLQKSTIEAAVRIFKSKFSLMECRFIEIKNEALTNTADHTTQNKTEPVNNPRKENPPKKHEATYEEAYNNLYGETDNSIIFGRRLKDNVRIRSLDSIVEEENLVIVEGKYVKTMDSDGKMQNFLLKEVRTGTVFITFSIADESNGIFVQLCFDNRNYTSPKDACNELMKKLKPGMYLRIKGNVVRDKYLSDAMVLKPSSIIKIDAPPEREDKAEIKRVELHCHTKMSKMDAVTSMEGLVDQAIKFGHKALAITDHGVVQGCHFCYKRVEKCHSDLKLIFGMEGYLCSEPTIKDDVAEQETGKPTKSADKKQKKKSYHIIILAKNEVGLRNLYKLVSISHLKYLERFPLLPREEIQQYREGLIIGSACEAGELYRAILAGAGDAELEEIASFYDYLEIQPIENNMFLVRKNICTIEDLKNHNRKIYELGKRLGKLTVSTCDVHFLNPEDAKLRAALQSYQHYPDADEQPPLYFRTTEEMLKEFEYLGKDVAYEVVVSNTNKIADMVDRLKPVPDEDQLYAPSIPGVEERVRNMVYDRAHEWYGDDLPKVVEDRLTLELTSIINNGFSVLYFIAHKLVKKSLDIGYLVGSRGSVGSSFVATMLDITEVNPLEPHYRCPKCKHSKFFLNNEWSSGFDMPVKLCPICDSEMIRDGHNIPFAVFLGFNGDKVPDIDLNFSEEAQHKAHEFTKVLFGRDNVCRAGTISTIANKIAKSIIQKYYEERAINVHPAYVNSMIEGLAGVKRTTGQHPGGIMVIPRNMDIHRITPMNWPADSESNKSIDITTHYDYHSINDRLVKLDILGHDDPSVIKLLENYLSTQDHAFDVRKEIPMGDEETLRIFQNTTSLGVTPEQIDSYVGTLGIPECGTAFVRQMINDVQPKCFSEIVRVSGYSHGTNVWLNNAQDLIKEGKPVSEIISTRDDIMTNLIAKGVEPSLAFKIMEHVRKGKAEKEGLPDNMLEGMQKANVPKWYIESCKKIGYLFPKAHAVAYVLMAYRIAWCKVHKPLAFYAAYFSIRAPEFDYGIVRKGAQYVKQYIRNVKALGFKATAKEKATVTYLELVNEMLERGYVFDNIDIYESDAERFRITDKGLRPPLKALSGVGGAAAEAISKVVDKNNPFISQEDLRLRAGVGKTVIELLNEVGALGDLPECSQMSLFDFM